MREGNDLSGNNRAAGRLDTRAALMKAGLHAFARRGFDGASVRDITREAGANLGAITYHFGSKRALYSEVLKANLTPVVDRVGIAAAGPGTPTERLSAVISVFFEQLSKNPELPRLMLQEVSAGKQPPPEVVAIVQRNAGYVMGILREGRAAGEMHCADLLFTTVSIVAQPLFMNIMAPLLREVGGIDMSHSNTRKAASEHVQAFVRAALQPREEA
jgi:AcrR family transcriptional regulator